MLTVGVALPIPEPWGEELKQFRLELGDDQARHIPTHITLLPPTPIAGHVLPALREHLSQVGAHHPSFKVVLRGTGTFRPLSDVVFIQVARGVAWCEKLEQQVRHGPVNRQMNFPYHPHVTIAHNVDEAALDHAFDTLAYFTADYVASFFRLYVHDGDEVWRSDTDFALRGPG